MSRMFMYCKNGQTVFDYDRIACVNFFFVAIWWWWRWKASQRRNLMWTLYDKHWGDCTTFHLLSFPLSYSSTIRYSVGRFMKQNWLIPISHEFELTFACDGFSYWASKSFEWKTTKKKFIKINKNVNIICWVDIW